MQKACVYFRVLRQLPDRPGNAPPTPLHVEDSRVGYSESSIIRFVRDPDHHCEVIAVPGKSRADIESALKLRFPHGTVVIELINWLT
jgi:hypothetical protein